MKTSLVLEGGGMRGAYTAGCLSWLLENHISFDAAYGISTGAVHLCSFLSENEDYLYDLSTNRIADKELVGLRSLLREGRFVGYEYLFNHILPIEKHYDISKAYASKTVAKIGIYDLEEGQTIFHKLTDMDKGNVMLKAATSLPILGRVVEYEGHHYLDGGITKMIPIEESIKDQNDLHLIITTKPGDYVRQPAKAPIKALIKMCYHKWPQVSKDYNVRHINYNDQIAIIKQLEQDHKALYIYPSVTIPVSRTSGDKENLRKLYQLGRDDMEKRRAEILAMFKKDSAC